MSAFRPYLLTACLLLVGISASAQEQIFKHTYQKAGDTTIEMQSIFGTAARNGALPFRVTIRNNTGRDRIWDIYISEGYSSRKLRTEATYRFPVEDGTEVTHDIVFRFAPAFAAYDYRNLTINVESPGLKDFRRSTNDQTNQDFPTIAISKPLGQRSLASLDDVVKKQNGSNQYFAKSYEPKALPPDWLSYTALDFLMIDLRSWNNLRDAQMRAILSWVRLGGNLDIYSEDETSTVSDIGIPGLPAEARSLRETNFSLGKIEIQQWNGQELNTSVSTRYRSKKNRSSQLAAYYDNSWDLQKQFETKDFNPALIFILLLAFAILVAPVNLFVFAKPGRRHRLFVTTPIISVAACIVIVAFIFFSDGLGGRGQRVVFADLQPNAGEMRLYTTQEQISRTGVMLSPGFESERRISLDPVNLPESAFNPLSNSSNRKTLYGFTQDNFSGGFFRSRSEQGFAIQNVEPTRARVELTAGVSQDGAPQLVSNLSFPVREFYFIDEKEKFWRSDEQTPIAPGDSISLSSVGRAEFEEWYAEKRKGFSNPLDHKMKELRSDSNRFFAVPVDPTAIAIPTHQSIDWTETRALLTGSVVDSIPTGDE